MGPELEARRVGAEYNNVFSYRFHPSLERYTLFDPDVGWVGFHKAALERAKDLEVVVSTDISDFYPRIYHHRLENELRQATNNSEAVRRIMEILKSLSGGVSYGLPVGGHAARLLAEMLLNRTDRLMRTANITFCRFVDDYFLFADSMSSAQRVLVQLSEVLLASEGLTLARAKTRVMSQSEFRKSSPLADISNAESEDEATAREFLGLRLAYDPYSPMADEQYEVLRKELERFDITGMLARELRKSRIDEALTRQLTKAVRFLPAEIRDGAILSLVRNLRVLYPIFPTVAILLHKILSDLSEHTKKEVFKTIRDLVNEESHILLVPANLSFAIRIVAHDPAEETELMLNKLYQRANANMMVKREVLLAMTCRRADHWLSQQLKRFSEVTPWERRALLPASYVLGDEGRHWRERVKRELNSTDEAVLKWVGAKNNGRVWDLPL
jgi:hypothetical protein